MAKQNGNKRELEKVQGGPPAHLAQRAAQDAGRGVSSDQADNLVPLIYVLQSNSPQVNKRGSEYLDGAEPGDIWLRNYTDPIVKGEEGFLFQPCSFSKDWVEWIPRSQGGGFAGRHDHRPAEAEEKPDPENPQKMRWTLPNGNHVVETRYHVGFVHLPDGAKLPYVIPMSSTAHTVSRGWMFAMNSKRVGDVVAPSWSCLYRLTTKERTNAAGTWFTWKIDDAGWVETEQDYDAGKALADAFESGAKVVDEPEHSENPSASGEDAPM